MLPKRLGDICAEAFLGRAKLSRKRCQSVGANCASPNELKDFEEFQARVDRLTELNEALQAQNTQLVQENAKLVQALAKAQEEASMAKSIAWKYDGNPPDCGGVLLTYANLVLAQASEALGHNRSERESPGSDSESECGPDGAADSGSDGGDSEPEDVTPSSKKARTKNGAATKPVVRRVRFGEECRDLINSFKTETRLDAQDVKLLEAVLTSQANQTFSSFCAYDIDFQTQWKTFSAHKTLFESFRHYYFERRSTSTK